MPAVHAGDRGEDAGGGGVVPQVQSSAIRDSFDMICVITRPALKPSEFSEVLSLILNVPGKGDHILAMNEVEAQVWECDLSVNGRTLKIKVPIAAKTKEEVRADILAKIANH